MTQTSEAAIVTSAAQKLATLRDLFEQNKRRIAEVIPKHVTPERLLKITLSSLSRSPEILECTRESIVRSVIQAAELGLEFGGTLGRAYLLPFRNMKAPGKPMEAMFIPGYRGLIHLARQSGDVLDVRAVTVHDGDDFDVDEGSAPRIVHRPNTMGDREDAAIVAVYCITKFRNGEAPFDWMSRSQVEKIRARSKAGQGGPWVTDFGEMAKKTVTKRRLKYVPMSTQLARAMAADNAFEEGDPDAADRPTLDTDVPALPPKGKSESLRERMRAQAGEATSVDARPEGVPDADYPPEPMGG